MTISDLSKSYTPASDAFTVIGSAYMSPEADSEGENDFRSAFLAQKQQLGQKILSGDTTPKFSIGAQEFSSDEWKSLMKRVDISIRPAEDSSIIDYLKADKQKCPYSALAKDGIIEYNGVFFTCDYDSNSLCLGSMAEGEDIITVNLPSGGTLKINADNAGEISKCAGMFTPEDLNAIIRAIHEHEHTKNKELQVSEQISAAFLG